MTAIVEKPRVQCHIDTDDATDDELLVLYFRTACRRAEDFISRKLYEETVSESDPGGILITDDVLLVLMLLVRHQYKNRENPSDVNKAPVPPGSSSPLESYHFIPLQEETCRRADYVTT